MQQTDVANGLARGLQDLASQDERYAGSSAPAAGGPGAYGAVVTQADDSAGAVGMSGQPLTDAERVALTRTSPTLPAGP